MLPFFRKALPCAFLCAAIGLSPAARADTVTIYRCVDAKGQVSLQDRACPRDSSQQMREMLRPQDAPPRPIVSFRAEPPPPVELRIVHERDPLPVYQCTTPDGDTYTNHTGVPQARYVPLWTTGVGRGSGLVSGRRGASSPSAGASSIGTSSIGAGGGAMTYVEDTCMRLPQEDVCASLRARDDQLETMIFNSQPDDRERYERERKGLAEQLRSDCGN